MFPKWNDWNIQYTRKGMIKLKIKRMLQVFALAAFLVGAFAIRKDPVAGLGAIPGVARRTFKSGLLIILGIVERGVSWLAK